MRSHAQLAAFGLIATLVVPLSGSAHADAPLYAAFTIDPDPGHAFFPDAEVRRHVIAAGAAAGLTLTGTGGVPWVVASITPPTSTGTLAAGTFTTVATATETAAGLNITNASQCAASSGTLTIHEVSFAPGGELASLAASYSQTCTGSTAAVHGELRYRSSLPYRAAYLGQIGQGVGADLVVGRTVTGPTYVVTNTGTADLTVSGGAFASTDWSVRSETCTTAPLHPNAQCTFSTTLRPSAAGARDTTFTVSDDTWRESRVSGATASAVVGHLYWAGSNFHGSCITRRVVGGASTDFACGEDMFAPTVSPDGTKVAYVAMDDDGYHVYVKATADGSAAIQLTSGDVFDDKPNWSPDGSTIAFMRYVPGAERIDVYTVPAAGGAATRLATNADHPSYSPSGRQIAVGRGEDFGIDVITVATRNRTSLPNTAEMMQPAWSPDGTKLLAVKLAPDFTSTFVMMPAGGGTVTTMHGAGELDVYPAWSTDGAHIYYTRGFDNDSAIRRMDADGSDDTLIQYVANTFSMAPSAFTAPPAVDMTPPAAPALSVIGVDNGKVQLSWTAPDDASEFVVRRVADGALVYDGSGTTATATGLVNGSTHAFSVVALDGWGNASPPAMASAQPLAVPSVTTPAVASSVGTGPAWTVKWGTTGATSYDVQYGGKVKQTNGQWAAQPTWKPWKTATTATSAPFAGQPGTTYWFRVRARDSFGNVTGWSVMRPTSVPFNENYAGIRKSAGWASTNYPGRWMSTVMYTTFAGKSMTYTADVQGFNVIGDRCASCGQFRVYVDGVLRATVDTRAAGTQNRQLLWSASLPGGIRKHTVQIVTLGTRGRPRVNIDGLALYR